MLSSSRCRAVWNINIGKTLWVLTLAFFFLLVAQLWSWQSFLHKSFMWLSCHLGVSVMNKRPVLAQCREGLSIPQLLSLNQVESKQEESTVILVSPSLPLAPPLAVYVFHSTHLCFSVPCWQAGFARVFFCRHISSWQQGPFFFNGPRFLMAFSLNIQSTPKVKKDTT